MTDRPWHAHELEDVEGLGPRWRDEKFPASADRLDSASSNYSFDYDELVITFDNNARILNERLGFIYQLNHDWEIGSPLRPHVHWIQKSGVNPNWYLKYRAYDNGDPIPAWTELAVLPEVFPYTSGTILQISPFPEIDMTGFGLSCIVDLIFGRDTGNLSGKFSGTDQVAGADFKEFDLHTLFDSRGSRQEYIK